jgi:hypothetical protein
MRNLMATLAASILLCASGQAQAAPMLTVSSIEELQGLAPGVAPAVTVISWHAGINKGGGIFGWDPNANAAPDGCTIFAAKGGSGRWVRQLSGPLDVTMCGAWWDNIHDEAPVLRHAFQVAAAQRRTASLPGGIGRVCSSVVTASGLIVRGQGMGTAGAIAASPTVVNGTCIKSGWVFDFVTRNSSVATEAPKYYDMSINMGAGAGPGGCIRWNSVDGGFTDSNASQSYMMHPHAERIYCEMNNRVDNQQIGFQCSKCFDGDWSQNEVMFGKTSMNLVGSDVMCIGCGGPNRVAGATDSLIRMTAYGTFGNMDRVVANEVLGPADFGQRYDSFIYDNTRSSTVASNHIEGAIKGGLSAIHVVQGFSHAITDNDIDVVTVGITTVPNWLVADGPFVNLRVFNNGCAGCLLNPARFNATAFSPNFNLGGVHQKITHGGNSNDGDKGFPPSP